MVKALSRRGRPKRCRRIGHSAVAYRFSPDRQQYAESVLLELDELEALRLCDLTGLYQADAARLMHVSRQTLGRILKSVHLKVADALINGKALQIQPEQETHEQHALAYGKSGDCFCPNCESSEIHKIGLPCRAAVCPRCGSTMLSKGSENHDP